MIGERDRGQPAALRSFDYTFWSKNSVGRS
jgi:hypothetical protein